MAEKIKSVFYRLSGAAVLAGFIILIIGVYYEVIKTGIPYQDPPLELQIQYAINMGVGNELCRIGFLTILYGAAFRLILRLIMKKRQKTG